MNRHHHPERHAVTRMGWLRASVLGANDGIVSTASLIAGIAASDAARGDIAIAGLAAMVAGAMSMAAGEYVSVSAQADAEGADLARERRELRDQPAHEQAELEEIYVGRGLSRELAHDVAVALTAHDALAAHARDELGITDLSTARPLQAAATSAASFALGAAAPLAVVAIAPLSALVGTVIVTSLVALALLGSLGAQAGGARHGQSLVRTLFWGALAMGLTTAVGHILGTAI